MWHQVTLTFLIDGLLPIYLACMRFLTEIRVKRLGIAYVFAAAVAATGLVAWPGVASTTEMIDVHVVVRGSSRLPVAAYVGLTADDRPMWQPNAESIAPLGEATFHLQPGHYRAVIGSPNYEDVVTDVVVASGHELRFDLAPAVLIRGGVFDDAGRPIQGATVTQTRLLGPVPAGIFSPTAREFFASQWRTKTDENGRWSLQGSSAGKVALLVEGRGYAPVGIMGSDVEQHLVLHRGSSLAVTFDRSESDLAVTLIPEATNTAELPPEWQPRVFGRVVSTPLVEWPSLPQGQYRLRARYLDPRRFSESFEIGSVDLASGGVHELAVTLPPTPKIAGNVRILFAAAKTTIDLVGSNAFARTSGGIDAVRMSTERAAGGVLLYLDTLAAPSDIYVLTNSSIITPEADAGTRDAVRCIVSPRADVVLRVKAASNAATIPRIANISYGLCDHGETIKLGVAIDADGGMALPYPASCRSAVIDLAPFEPIIIGAGRINAGEKRALGERVVRIGGVVELRVAEDPTGTPVPNAVVRAFGETNEEQIGIVSGETDAKGHLLLRGLPVERDVTIEARDPRSDRTGSVHVRIDVGKIAKIDPLPIPQPAALSVAPRLPAMFRERFPAARIQSITLDRADAGGASLRRHSEVTKSGEVRFENLQPGHWLIVALVEALDSVHVLSAGDIELRPGEDRRATPEVTPAVFEGVVTFGGKGLAATLVFDDPPSPTSVGRYVHTDKDGHFTVLLPAPGTYSVQATPFDQPKERIGLGDVEMKDTGEPVRLEIPYGSLLVTVKEGGEPLRNADVRATLERNGGGLASIVPKIDRTNPSGQVQFDALLDGLWVVHVEAEGVSAEGAVMLGRNEQRRLDLVAEPSPQVAGFVHDRDDHPVADASVDCLYSSKADVPGTAHGTTDYNGHFAVRLPPLSRPLLNCGVSTPSGVAAAFTSSPTLAADFTLPSDVAALTISDWGLHLQPNLYWLVADDGRLFNLTWIAGRTRALWSPLLIRSLAAGSWKIVRAGTVEEWMRLGSAGGNALNPIRTFSLRAGDSRTVRLYSESEDRDHTN